MSEMKGHVLLDLDGTLVDSLGGIESSIRHALRAEGVEWATKDLRSMIGPPVRIIFATIVERADSEKLDRLCASFRTDYDLNGWRETVPYRAVGEVLSKIIAMGASCHIVTNKPSRPTRAILEKMGWLVYLSEIVTPDSTYPQKRSKAEVVSDLLVRVGMSNRNAILVGDTVDDADAATSNGIEFIGATYGYGARELLALNANIRMISDITELPSVLRET